MPQDDPEKRAQIARMRAILGFDAPITEREQPGSQYGGFNTLSGDIEIAPGQPHNMRYLAHEGSHAQDYEGKNWIGRAIWQAKVAATIPDKEGNPTFHLPIRGIERRAEEGGEAYRIMQKINQMTNPEVAGQWLDYELDTPQSVGDYDVLYGFPNRDAILEKIQEYSRHQSNRGSMIRRALLASGRELQ